ncbi:hypothetical protein L3i20_v224050 [Paenibacillus sp. L3-i20]|nr:hypothetical protein L3i20_v224050 [Paenibacillus sp. L3-i20]
MALHIINRHFECYEIIKNHVIRLSNFFMNEKWTSSLYYNE